MKGVTPPSHQGRPPYELPSNIVYFHDWRYVDHGSVGWRDAAKDPKEALEAEVGKAQPGDSISRALLAPPVTQEKSAQSR